MNFRHAVVVGGFLPNRYAERQIPFFGFPVGFRETAKFTLVPQLDLRYRFLRKNYATVRAGLFMRDSSFKFMFLGSKVYAFGAEYARQTIVGPLRVAAQWCDVTGFTTFPARAVVPEKDFQSTLNSLLQELRQSYASAQESDTLMVNNREQREAFDRVLKSADEVTIMLYTQRPEFTFDMAFALEEVSRVKSAFHEQVLLNDQYRIAARSGLRRYELLNETLQDMLRRQPADSLAGADSLALAPVPLEAEDPEKAALLDSCRPRAEGQRPLRGDRGPAPAGP